MLFGNKNKFSAFESKAVLMSIQSAARLGRSITQSIQMIFEAEKKGSKTKILMQRVLKDITLDNQEPSVALSKVGVLNGIEPFMLRSTGKVQKTIKNILDIREVRGVFETTLLKIFALPVLMIIIALTGLVIIEPKLKEATKFVVTLVKGVRNVDISSELDKPWWYDHTNLVILILILFISTIISIIVYYIYYINNNPKIIYKNKFFSMKVYDDVLLYFRIIAALRESGMTGLQMLELLFKNTDNKGWKRIFKQLMHEINSTGNANSSHRITKIFEDNYIPKDILINLKSAEIGGNLWGIFDELANFANDKIKENNIKLITYLKFPMLLVGYGILIYAMMSIFMYGISLMLIMQTSLI